MIYIIKHVLYPQRCLNTHAHARASILICLSEFYMFRTAKRSLLSIIDITENIFYANDFRKRNFKWPIRRGLKYASRITKTSVTLRFQSYYINIKFSRCAPGIRNMSWRSSRKYGIFIGYHTFSCVGWNLYFCGRGWI